MKVKSPCFDLGLDKLFSDGQLDKLFSDCQDKKKGNGV